MQFFENTLFHTQKENVTNFINNFKALCCLNAKKLFQKHVAMIYKICLNAHSTYNFNLHFVLAIESF